MSTYERLVDEVIAGSDRALKEIGTLIQKPKALNWKNRAVLRAAATQMQKAMSAIIGDDSTATCSLTSAKQTEATTVFYKYKVESAGIKLLDDAQKGACDLGLDQLPEVFEFRECDDGEAHDIVNFKNVAGLYHKNENAVYVRSDLNYRGSLETLGHELWHAYERQNGRAADEDAADDYGRRFADWLTYGTPT